MSAVAPEFFFQRDPMVKPSARRCVGVKKAQRGRVLQSLQSMDGPTSDFRAVLVEAGYAAGELSASRFTPSLHCAARMIGPACRSGISRGRRRSVEEKSQTKGDPLSLRLLGEQPISEIDAECSVESTQIGRGILGGLDDSQGSAGVLTPGVRRVSSRKTAGAPRSASSGSTPRSVRTYLRGRTLPLTIARSAARLGRF